MATKILAVAALLMAAFFASAQSFWDGGAALERGDASFESGYYAASNSFPAGTQVVVENLETGSTTTVLVSGRIEGQSDLLILLSPKAAAALGIITGDVAPVRVTLKSAAPVPGGSSTEDRALSRDSDVNPAAGAPRPASAPKETPIAAAPKAAETPATAQTPAETSPGVLESLPKGTVPKEAAAVPPKAAEPSVPAEKKPAIAEAPKAAQTPVEKPAETPAPAQPAAQTPAKPAPSPEELARELASRNPQKQLYQPPREDQKFAYQPPAKPPEYTAAAPKEAPKEAAKPAEEVPANPEIASVDGSISPPTAGEEKPALAEAGLPPGLNPRVDDLSSPEAPGGQALAEITPPAPAAPAPGSAEELAAVPPELSAPSPPAPAAETRTEIALEPTTPKPPETATTPEKPAAGTTQVAQVPPAELPAERPTEKPPQAPASAKTPAIAKADYFLQLGAYTDEKQARDLVARIPQSYPVNVVAPAASGARYFRILLGPLNKAESGTLLYWFRDRGFPDAFVKTGE